MNTYDPRQYSLVPLGEDRLADMTDLDAWAFINPATIEQLMAMRPAYPHHWGRAYGMVTPDGRLVAEHESYAWGRFPVPGGFVPAAGLTGVGVHPEHRRRGLLRGMITAHLAQCAERGEAVSVLDASEPGIYGRFGYGTACYHLNVTVPRGAALRPVPGSDQVTVRIDHADPEKYAEAVATVQREAAWAAGLVRPGWTAWDTPDVAALVFRDPPEFRHGHEPLRLMLAERDGHPVGYALFHRKENWVDANPRGEVAVTQLAYTQPAAAHALWSRLLDLDLTSTVKAELLPVDDPLLGLLVDQRAAVPKVCDNLWVRVIDIPRALAGRQYQANVDVVLEVADALVPANAGRWRLRASAFSNGAEVARTDASPDLTLDVRELGAAYLGGTSLAALAAGGLLEARSPQVLAAASAAFSWPIAPAVNWVF